MAGELILVVDDGQENREFILEYVLQPNGYRGMVARDGREGLEMIARHQPDLILLDYQMPRMNGIEMLKAMAAQNMQIPVILMTFYGSEEVAVEVYRLGVRDYIKKPFSVDEMLAAIERSLTDVRLRREKEALTERLIAANRELQNRLQELNILYSIGKSVTALMEMEQLLPRIVDAAIKLTGGEEGFLYLSAADGSLLCLASKTHEQTRAVSTRFAVKDRNAAHVISTGQPLVLGADKATAVGASSLALAPLMLRGSAIGVLGVRNVSATIEPFDKHDSALLSALTDYAAIAIQNARNVEALRETKEHEKAQIRSTFGRFVSPQVVDQVLDHPEKLQLGGSRREVTILFADIRGYTAYSENSPPEQVVEMLNDYLSLAANVIMSYGGTLDKYMGDGIMAIFNAPQEQPDHVQLAVDAAFMLQQAALQLAKQRGEQLSFGVGINVGETIVGYIGTDTAINYTAVGDAVNVAKRLQEVARPGQILVEEAVVERLKGTLTAHSLGELKMKGRQKNAVAYELTASTASR